MMNTDLESLGWSVGEEEVGETSTVNGMVKSVGCIRNWYIFFT
jgi:hypothetical protein